MSKAKVTSTQSVWTLCATHQCSANFWPGLRRINTKSDYQLLLDSKADSCHSKYACLGVESCPITSQ